MNEFASCEVFFTDEKTKQFKAALNIPAHTDGLSYELKEKAVNKCRLISLRLKADKDCKNNLRLRSENPVRLYLPMAQPQALTAMYMLNPWWTRPAFVSGFDEIPQKSRIVFARYADCFGCFFPMIGKHFVTMIGTGRKSEMLLEMSAGTELTCGIDEPVLLYAEGTSVQEAVRKVFAYLEKRENLLPRTERKLPEMLRYLGWCSWDAFYRDVNEEGIRAKAKELAEKNIPVRWMLVDDGWQQVSERTMDACEPDPAKFPHGFRRMTEDIRSMTMVKWFGVWHTLFGYWDGITPGSSLWADGAENLIRAADGKILPDPAHAEGFFRKWYEQLRNDGINFTKVDGQSSLADLYKNTVPVPPAAKGVSAGLEKASDVFQNAVINCMGMAMENILARPSLAVSRNSDDFVPSRENGFAEHLLQNAYNSLYHNELYCCDWDMFWTRHPQASEHALIRAVSGGPVYFSDRVGETDEEIVKTLCYPDGELLIMSRSAMPSADCIFNDPLKSGVLKLQNAGMYAGRSAGGIAVFNLTETTQSFGFDTADIPELDSACQYLVYDWFRKEIINPSEDGRFHSELPPGGYAWYVFLPADDITCIGLSEKYAGFTAVEDAFTIGRRTDFVLHACGSVGFSSAREIRSVSLNDKKVTELLEQTGSLYTLRLPEKEGKTILSVTI